MALLTAALDEARPRYLAAIRGPEELLHAIDAGIDLVESAAPQELAARGSR